MSEDEELPDQIIEPGKTYEHEKHGKVEVTGIWQGVSRVDTSRTTDAEETIIVRYAIDEGNGDIELTDTLDAFAEDIR